MGPENVAMPPLLPVSFDAPTRTLSFVPDFFDGKIGRNVKLSNGIVVGANISVGTELAIIFWNNGNRDAIVSPIAGQIEVINGKINNANLGFVVQFLLTIRG